MAQQHPQHQQPKVLFLDAYDSFSNNIIALLRADLCAHVTVLKIDDERFINSPPSVFYNYISSNGFDAVVAGPGPGDPRNEGDVGLINALWGLSAGKHDDEDKDDDENADANARNGDGAPSIPQVAVLGICLGFQSLVLCHGGSVSRLKEPRHGFTTPISHRDESIFSGLREVHGTQYHSLRASLHHVASSCSPSSSSSRGEVSSPAEPDDDIWRPSPAAPQLVPLAYDLSEPQNGPILMSVKHSTRPFWGLQYHPESICTSPSGREVVRKWWEEAGAWLGVHRLRRSVNHVAVPLPVSPAHSRDQTEAGEHGFEDIDAQRASGPEEASRVGWTSFPASQIDVASIKETLDLHKEAHESLLLESGTKNGASVRPETGRYSVIGLAEPESFSLRYWTHDSVLKIHEHGQSMSVKADMNQVFRHLKTRQTAMKAHEGPDIPFWGGLIGYISYEAGLETINVPPSPQFEAHLRPDVWFVAISRSVVVDHATAIIYVQSLKSDDQPWINGTKLRLQAIDSPRSSPAIKAHQTRTSATKMYDADRNEYLAKVRKCQAHIRAGSSYELCLTDQTIFDSSVDVDPWDVYRDLRISNPAPFGAYIRFAAAESARPDLTFLSSSPERFMTWSRSGACQFRPIKGTVKKGVNMTREKAESILKSRKEQAENLMIVDLIRHDLHGVISTVARVEKLMQVEEYETVYQLVSVIEGDLSNDQCGIDVLATSLPPGSMTGAPKKRSCELLNGIECHRRRGLYSGVMGYLDAGGGGDFSVVIRSMIKYRDEWRVGAGGAVTALSVPEDEFEEMQTKCSAVLAHWNLKPAKGIN